MAESSSSVFNYSCVCDDVRRALKKCKPPTNFELVESHLTDAQKPCGPKHTFADLSQVDNVLRPQEVALNPESNSVGADWEASSSSHNHGRFGRAESERGRGLAASTSFRCCSSAKYSNEQSVDERSNVLRERKIHNQSSRARNPEVPEFLKKFLIKKRELGDEGHQMYSARSVQTRVRDTTGAEREARRPAEWIDNSAFKGNERSSQDGSDENQAVHLPGSPDSFLAYQKGSKTENVKEACAAIFTHGSRSGGSSLDGIMSYSPPQFHSNQKDGETEDVLYVQKEDTPSKEVLGKECHPRSNETSSSFFVTVETLLEGRAALKKIQSSEKSENNATGAIRSRTQKLVGQSVASASEKEMRESLCQEVRRGLNLRNGASEPLQETRKQIGHHNKRSSMMEIPTEMLKHVQNIRSSVQHDSDSCQSSCD